jgi:hypothetical protein
MIQRWQRSASATEENRPDDGLFEIEERIHQRLIRDIDESVLRGLDAERAR